MTAHIGKLSESEWNFRDLTHQRPTHEQWIELNAAIVYEYARESQSLRNLAKEFAALPLVLIEMVEQRFSLTLLEGHPLATKVSPALLNLDLLRFWNCLLWPKYFPNTPWLDIPHAARSARIQRYFDANPPARIVEINGSMPIDGRHLLGGAGRCLTDTGEYMLVRVEYGDSNNSDIAAAFEELLHKRRPKNLPELRTKSSRVNVTGAALTRLAVMRLLNRHRYDEAVARADSRDFAFPAQSIALNMRKRVVADLRKIFLSTDFVRQNLAPLVPLEELPLRYETATRQSRRARGN